MVFEALATLGAAFARQAGRLVDPQHQGIAIEQPSHHLFRCHGETAITARIVSSLPFTRFRVGGRETARQLFHPTLTKHVKDQPMAEQNWWQRLNSGLRRTSTTITGAIFDLAAKRKLNAAMIGAVEPALVPP